MRGIVLALLLGGCAGVGIEPAALEAPTQTGSIVQPIGPAETAHSELHKVHHKAVEEARRSLGAFLADKSADCSSPKLKEAVSKVRETTAALAAAMRPDYLAMLEAGAAVLDVADGANKRGCTRDAKELYDFVVRNFAGLGYAELRERATAGIKSLRARGLTRPDSTRQGLRAHLRAASRRAALARVCSHHTARETHDCGRWIDTVDCG